jgi:vacuolar-type H+-ATPase subunit F/Vma7
MMEKIGQLKIGIMGERRDIIFLKGLGFEIFPVGENINEVLDLIEKREDLGIIFISQDLISKIKKEKLEELEKRIFPVIVSLPLKEKREISEELKEIMKRAIGKEEIGI